MAAQYLVIWSLVNSPNGAFYQGREVTAADLGADAARIEHLIGLGAIEPVAEAETPPAATPALPAPAPESAKSGAGDGAAVGDDAGGTGAAGLVLTAQAGDGEAGGQSGSEQQPDALLAVVGDAKVAAALRAAGYGTPQEVAGATDEQLRGIEGVGPGRLAKLRAYAQPAPPVME